MFPDGRMIDDRLEDVRSVMVARDELGAGEVDSGLRTGCGDDDSAAEDDGTTSDVSTSGEDEASKAGDADGDVSCEDTEDDVDPPKLNMSVCVGGR